MTNYMSESIDGGPSRETQAVLSFAARLGNRFAWAELGELCIARLVDSEAGRCRWVADGAFVIEVERRREGDLLIVWGQGLPVGSLVYVALVADDGAACTSRLMVLRQAPHTLDSMAATWLHEDDGAAAAMTAVVMPLALKADAEPDIEVLRASASGAATEEDRVAWVQWTTAEENAGRISRTGVSAIVPTSETRTVAHPVRVEDYSIAAASSSNDVTVGQLTPGVYEVTVKSIHDDGPRAEIEIQPYAGAVRIRAGVDTTAVLRLAAEPARVLSSDRWITVSAEPDVPIRDLLAATLLIEPPDLELEYDEPRKRS